MTPDDPRHGTYAGYQAHRKANTPVCDPCDSAAYTARKVQRHRSLQGHSKLVTIGDQVWQITMDAAPQALADAIGVNRTAIYKIRRRGPQGRILPATKAAILATGISTSYIGLQRRLQATTALGYSLSQIASRTNGIRRETLSLIRTKKMDFVCGNTRREIVRVYNELAMQPAPDTRSAQRCRNFAARHGWASSFAWDDDTIDDPNACPQGLPTRRRVGVGMDEAAILRRIEGDRDVQLRGGEATEVVLRMTAARVGPAEIEERTGINAARILGDLRRAEQAAQTEETAA